MAIDYTSTPLPANGQARSAAALAAIFTNIQTTYNGEVVTKSGTGVVSSVTSLAAVLANSVTGLKLTQPATGSAPFAQFFAANGTTQVAAVDSGGNFIGNAASLLGAVTAGNLIANMIASTTGLKLVQPAGITNPPFVQFFANDGVTSHLSVDYAGNLVSAGNMLGVQAIFSASVAGSVGIFAGAASTPNLKLTQPAGGSNPDFLNLFASDGVTGKGKIDWSGNLANFNTATFVGAVTAPAFHGVADSALAMAGTGITDYKASPGSAGQVSIAAGGAYEDSNGNVVGPLGAQTANLPTQPTGTNVQYVGISLAPGTGAPTVTAAAVSAALSTLILPTANKPLCYVIWRGVTTNPSGVVAAVDIVDLRLPSAAGGAGGGGGAGIATTAAVLTEGDLTGSYPNTINVRDSTKGLALHPANIATAATNDGTYADAFTNYLPADIVTRISPFSSTQMQVQAGSTNTTGLNSPVTLVVNGRIRKNTAAVTATATGSAGTRYVVADLSAASAGFSLVSPMPSSLVGLGVYQVPLAALVWDGAAIQPGVLDLTNVINLGSPQLTLTQFTATNSTSDTFTSTGTQTATVAPNMNSAGPFEVPTAMAALVMFSVEGNAHGVLTGEYFQATPAYRFANLAASPAYSAWTAVNAYNEGSAIWGQTVATTSDTWGHTNGVAYMALNPGIYQFNHLVQYHGASSASVTLTLYNRQLRVMLLKG